MIFPRKQGLQFIRSENKIEVYRKYLLPGVVFQSVVVGGGYGTGREIAEFFMPHGPLGGLMGMAAAAICWSVVLAVAFEFGRITKSYDYRRFFRFLLGPFWRVFELVYLCLALVVLAVLGSAAGEIFNDMFNLPSFFGTLILLGAIGFLTFYGSDLLAPVLSVWSALLYVLYALFLVLVFNFFGGEILSALKAGGVQGAWAADGVRYASYNFVAFAAVLFATRHIETRAQAFSSGALAGLIGIIPAVFVFVAMLAGYPEITSEAVPVSWIISEMNLLWFAVVFQVILFGTFIETGAGITHSINERVASVLEDRGAAFPSWARLLLSLGALTIAVFLALRIGIIDLIASGYGALSYALIAVMVLPLLTIGLWKIFKSSKTTTNAT